MTSHLVMSDELSDVVLKVRHNGYTWRYAAHSVILSSRSTKFKELFEERIEGEVPIPLTFVSVHPDSMLQILRYIYANEYPTEVDADLLFNAGHFELTELKEYLEDSTLQNLTIPKACEMLEGLQKYQFLAADYFIKIACMSIIEKYAFFVFSSDLVLEFSQNTLLMLLKSDNLNVPDEAIIFWGVWRWGRRYRSQIGLSIDDVGVVEHIEDMLPLLRLSSLRQNKKIPEVALEKFSSCCCRRSHFEPPEDTLEFCTTWNTSGSWENLTDAIITDQGTLCLQMSFSKSVMLAGITFEICAPCIEKATLFVFLEKERRELLRQEINCGQFSFRKLSRTGEPEAWLKGDVLLSEPLILSREEIYSIYLLANGKMCSLPTTLLMPRKKKLSNVITTVHGQQVSAVKELHIMPDVKATWGS